MNSHLHHYLLKQYCLTFFKISAIIAIIWSFTLAVRFFIRQELFNSEIYLKVALLTLPGVLPYVCCISSILFLLKLQHKNEFNLLKHLGFTPILFFKYLILIVLNLSILMFIYECLLKPSLKYSLKQSSHNLLESFFNQSHIKEFHLSNKSFYKTNKDHLIIKSHHKQKTTIISKSVQQNLKEKNPLLQLNQGQLFFNTDKQNYEIQFKQLLLTLSHIAPPRGKDLQLHQLTFSSSEEWKILHLMFRNVLAIPTLILLGLFLGSLAPYCSNSKLFFMTTTYILAIYFPLTIATRKNIFSHESLNHISLYFPILFTLLLICFSPSIINKKKF